MTTIINRRLDDHYDIYIGRRDMDTHFGNPFSHISTQYASVRVESRMEAIRCFREWLLSGCHNSSG